MPGVAGSGVSRGFESGTRPCKMLGLAQAVALAMMQMLRKIRVTVQRPARHSMALAARPRACRHTRRYWIRQFQYLLADKLVRRPHHRMQVRAL